VITNIYTIYYDF